MPEAVDVSSLLALRRMQRPGKPDAVARIAANFLAETHERLSALRAAAQANDAPAIERTAHALKGIAGTVGAHEMQDLARQLEILGRDGQPTAARDMVAALENAFRRAQPVFEELRDGV